MEKTTLLFDFFGVFVADTYNAWSADMLPADVAKQIRNEVMGKVDLDQIDHQTFFKCLSGASHIEQSQVEKDWQQYIQIDADLVTLVKELKEQYVVALCSNAATWEIHPILERFELMPLFERVFISAQMQLVKPDESYFLHVLEALEISAGEAVFIDDNHLNVSAAQGLGIEAIRFDNAPQLRRELADRSLF